MAVTPEDIAVELGRPTPAADSVEFAQWTRWIGRARLLIEARLGDLTALDQAVLDEVVLLAVAAHAKNPDSATQVDVRVDDASTSRRYSTSSGSVLILDEWWALLDPDLVDSSGVGSTQMYGEPDESTYDPWLTA
jgi:hypothetical protein